MDVEVDVLIKLAAVVAVYLFLLTAIKREYHGPY